MSKNYPIREVQNPTDTTMVTHVIVNAGATTADPAETDIGANPSATERQVLVSISIANVTGATATVRLRSSAAGAILAAYTVPDTATLVVHRRHIALPGDSITREVVGGVASGTLYVSLETAIERYPA